MFAAVGGKLMGLRPAYFMKNVSVFHEIKYNQNAKRFPKRFAAGGTYHIPRSGIYHVRSTYHFFAQRKNITEFIGRPPDKFRFPGLLLFLKNYVKLK